MNVNEALMDGAHLEQILILSTATIGHLKGYIGKNEPAAKKNKDRAKSDWEEAKLIIAKYPDSVFIQGRVAEFLTEAKERLPPEIYPDIYE